MQVVAILSTIAMRGILSMQPGDKQRGWLRTITIRAFLLARFQPQAIYSCFSELLHDDK